MNRFSGRGSHSTRDTRRIDAEKEYWDSIREANASDDEFDRLTGRAPRDPYRDPDPPRGPSTRRNPINPNNPGEDWKPDSPPRSPPPPPPPPNRAHVGLATVMTLALLAGSSNSVMNERERQTTMRKLKTEYKKLNSAKNDATKIASHMQHVAGADDYLSWEKSVALEKVLLKLYGDKMDNVIRKLPSRKKREAMGLGEISTYTSKEVKAARDAIDLNIALIQKQKDALKSKALKSKARLETQKTKRQLKTGRALTIKTRQNKRSGRGGRQTTRKKKR